MNHIGQMLARAQQKRTGIDGGSMFGDAWVYAEWHHKPDEPHPLMVEMLKLVPWWGRKHVESVRFRPDPDPADGSNPYLNGTATVFYKLPGQYLGPYLSRSRRMVDGEYFRLTQPTPLQTGRAMKEGSGMAGGKKRKLTEDDKRLKKALEPFLRAYRVSIEPFQGNSPDERGLRDVLPGVWPTVDNLRALVAAAVANNMDYDDR